MSYRITELWAFTTIGPDDEEGVIGQLLGSQWFPFVAADHARVNDLRPLAEGIERSIGSPVRLRHFVMADDDGAAL